MSTQPQDDDGAVGKPDDTSDVASDKVAGTPDDTPAATPTEKTAISTNRIVLWVIVGAIGLYLVGSGVWGILFR
jgi:hypothetical protein